jgi:hypothetical protein
MIELLEIRKGEPSGCGKDFSGQVISFPKTRWQQGYFDIN